MIKTANSNKNKGLSTIAVVLMGAASIMGLQSCGGSGDSTPPPPIVDQDPSGLYKSGTGTLDGTGVSDIIAFVHNSRLMAFSVTTNILIDGTIDSVTANDYVATVNVYKDGVLDQANVNVTGMVTNASQISGTLNGTGVGSGDFTVTFDPLYSRGATNARINSAAPNNPWKGAMMTSVSGIITNSFEFRSDNTYGGTMFLATTIVCIEDGNFLIPDSGINIYTLEESIEQGLACPAALIAADYTGFSAVVDDASTDDTLLYAISNGASSVFGVLTQQ